MPRAADDEEGDPVTIAEVDLSSEAIAGGEPNANLKPALRPASPPSQGSAASEDAETPVVHLDVRWCVAEPFNDTYNWAFYHQRFDQYKNRGLTIRTVRIADAPVWAVRSDCVTDAEQSDVKLCPPRTGTEEDLKSFARAFATEFGGTNGGYGIERVAFWNEPNLAPHWGLPSWPGEGKKREAGERYSDLLARFANGAKLGYGDIKIDAGEVAAGSPEGDNGARSWASYFTDYNSDLGRNGNYNVLTIHPYSEFAYQIPAKVGNYLDLRGVNSVGVTEFAWGVSGAGNFRCVDGQQAQATRFLNTVGQVTASQIPVQRLVWFSVIDNRKPEGAKCPDNTGHYDATVRSSVNTYGLYKRAADGTLPTFGATTPRSCTPNVCLLDAFRAAQD